MLKHISRENISKLFGNPRLLPAAVAKLLSTEKDERNWTLQYRLDVYETVLRVLPKFNDTPVEPVEIVDVVPDVRASQDCSELMALFQRYGSDKATKHDYYRLYAGLLSGRRQEALTIFEVGIGTNNPSRPSTMGKYGKPGASLRAFRDWAPNATIVGADVDKDILFTEPRITTRYIDQLDTAVLQSATSDLADGAVHLFIDDGLHEPHANANTLHAALRLVGPGGHIVIEDIEDTDVPLWPAVIGALRHRCIGRLVRTKAAYVCVFTVRKD